MLNYNANQRFTNSRQTNINVINNNKNDNNKENNHKLSTNLENQSNCNPNTRIDDENNKNNTKYRKFGNDLTNQINNNSTQFPSTFNSNNENLYVSNVNNNNNNNDDNDENSLESNENEENDYKMTENDTINDFESTVFSFNENERRSYNMNKNNENVSSCNNQVDEAMHSIQALNFLHNSEPIKSNFFESLRQFFSNPVATHLWHLIVDEITETHFYFFLKPNILDVAIEYAIRLTVKGIFNNKNKTQRHFIESLCLFVANKMEEGHELDYAIFGDKYPASFIAQKELEFGSAIEWNFQQETRFGYLLQYLKLIDMNVNSVISEDYSRFKNIISFVQQNCGDNNQKKFELLKNEEKDVEFAFLTRFICDMSYYDISNWYYSNSEVAIACIYVAYCINNRQYSITPKISRLLSIHNMTSKMESLMMSLIRLAQMPNNINVISNDFITTNNNHSVDKSNCRQIIDKNLNTYLKYIKPAFYSVSNVSFIQTSIVKISLQTLAAMSEINIHINNNKINLDINSSSKSYCNISLNVNYDNNCNNSDNNENNSPLSTDYDDN